MARPPSDKTALANMRRELKQVRKDLSSRSLECDRYRRRATQAEQELAEWKKRFDLLLARTPAPPAVPSYTGVGMPALTDCGCPSGYVCMNTACPRKITVTCATPVSAGERTDG